jgi:hypothetical protein
MQSCSAQPPSLAVRTASVVALASTGGRLSLEARLRAKPAGQHWSRGVHKWPKWVQAPPRRRAANIHSGRRVTAFIRGVHEGATLTHGSMRVPTLRSPAPASPLRHPSGTASPLRQPCVTPAGQRHPCGTHAAPLRHPCDEGRHHP